MSIRHPSLNLFIAGLAFGALIVTIVWRLAIG